MLSIVYQADQWLQDRLDIADIWIAQRRLHWARIDLAQYLDAHPVLTVDPYTNKAEVHPDATAEEAQYAMQLFTETQRLHSEFLSLERWYMSNPSVAERHSPHVFAKRFSLAFSGPVMLPPPA